MGGSKKSKRRDEYSEEDDFEDENLEEALTRHTGRKGFDHGQKLGKHLEVPTPRVNATFTAGPDGQLVLFGGEHYDGKACQFFNDLFVWEDGQWYKVVTAIGPSPRSSHQAAWGPDGKLYVFGGEFGTSKETKFLHYRDFWRLNPSDWTWECLDGKGGPSARSGHRMTNWGNSFLVLFGGFIDTCSDKGKTTYLDDLWLYDFASGKWKLVDWLNQLAPKPSARSAFQLAAFGDDGVLLYGGYTQVPSGKKNLPQGVVLNDIWILKMDGQDPGTLRWDKKKTHGSAPMPRSGCASVRVGADELLVFGGVFDEELSDEFIQGTCSNDLHSYSFRTNKWTKVEYGLVNGGDDDDASSAQQQQHHHQICPRFNAMMTKTGDGRVYLYGGIWEIGNIEYTLDDLYQVDGALIRVLRGISVDLSNWQELIEQDRREMMMSSDEDDDGSEDDSESSEEESDDEAYGDTNTALGSPAHPPVNRKKHRTLKDYFDDSTEHWIQAAKMEIPLASDKDTRKAAFMLAKVHWDETALIDSVENL